MKKVDTLRDLLNNIGENPICIRYIKEDTIQELSGTEFITRVRSIAAQLQKRGLGHSHVGIYGMNSVEWILYFCAILYAGAVAIPLCTDWTPQELQERIRQVDMDAILYDTLYECSGDLIEIPMEWGTTEIPEEVSVSDSENEEEPALILFTAGTTAKSKAVVLSKRALLASFCSEELQGKFDAQLAVMPLYHLAGFATALNTLYLKAVLCIGEGIQSIFRDLKRYEVDYLYAVPSLMKVVTQKLKGSFQCRLKTISCGGASFPAETLEILRRRGITIIQNYGASEAGALGLICEMDLKKPDILGRPAAGVQIQIVEGELYLKSDSLMSGYYKDPQATAEVLKNGWYATGDLCSIDEEGDLRLLGRKKAIIVLSNGKNISPEEIETRLETTSVIREVRIYKENDALAAQIAAEECMEDEIREVIKAYNEEVPMYKQIRKWYVQQRPLERNAMGKLLRNTKEV